MINNYAYDGWYYNYHHAFDREGTLDVNQGWFNRLATHQSWVADGLAFGSSQSGLEGGGTVFKQQYPDCLGQVQWCTETSQSGSSWCQYTNTVPCEYNFYDCTCDPNDNPFMKGYSVAHGVSMGPWRRQFGKSQGFNYKFAGKTNYNQPYYETNQFVLGLDVAHPSYAVQHWAHGTPSATVPHHITVTTNQRAGRNLRLYQQGHAWIAEINAYPYDAYTNGDQPGAVWNTAANAPRTPKQVNLKLVGGFTAQDYTNETESPWAYNPYAGWQNTWPHCHDVWWIKQAMTDSDNVLPGMGLAPQIDLPIGLPQCGPWIGTLIRDSGPSLTPHAWRWGSTVPPEKLNWLKEESDINTDNNWDAGAGGATLAIKSFGFNAQHGLTGGADYAEGSWGCPNPELNWGHSTGSDSSANANASSSAHADCWACHSPRCDTCGTSGTSSSGGGGTTSSATSTTSSAATSSSPAAPTSSSLVSQSPSSSCCCCSDYSCASGGPGTNPLDCCLNTCSGIGDVGACCYWESNPASAFYGTYRCLQMSQCECDCRGGVWHGIDTCCSSTNCVDWIDCGNTSAASMTSASIDPCYYVARYTCPSWYCSSCLSSSSTLGSLTSFSSTSSSKP